MWILFLFLLFEMFAHFNFSIKGFDKNYLSRDNTTAIKGIFIMCVFLSHVRGYVEYTFVLDQVVIQVMDTLGQYMVTLFLFYSGYGIYESIKRKGMDYVNQLPINRLGKTFFDFSVAIILYWILGILLSKNYPIDRVLLSFTGWSGIGNSNWYMFAIFTLYIITYISFCLLGKNKLLSIIGVSFLSLVYVYVMSDLQPDRFSNTYLCFAAGMWFSYLKDGIENVMKKKGVYPICLFILLICFIIMDPKRDVRLVYYNLASILFCLLVVFISMKITLNSKALIWMGNHLFWIYILQRIPMILLKHVGFAQYPYFFLAISFAYTIVMSKYMAIWMNQLKSIVFKSSR